MDKALHYGCSDWGFESLQVHWLVYGRWSFLALGCFISSMVDPKRPISTKKVALVEVLLLLPLNKTFTYRLPDYLVDKAKLGYRVVVPFRKRLMVGILWDIKRGEAHVNLKEVVAIPDRLPIWDKRQRLLVSWLAAYYAGAIGKIAELALGAIRRLFTIEIKLKAGADSNWAAKSPEAQFYKLVSKQEKLTWQEAKVHFPLNELLATLSVMVRERVILVVPPYNAPLPLRAHITLHPDYATSEGVEKLQHQLRKAGKQGRVLSHYLSLAPDKASIGGYWIAVSALLAEGLSRSSVATLVEKSIFQLEKREERTVQRLVPTLSAVCPSRYVATIEHLWKSNRVVLLAGRGVREHDYRGKALITSLSRQDGQMLYLLPGEGLADDIVKLMQQKLGGSLVYYHARLSPQRKHFIWEGVALQRIRFVVGTAAALFLPFVNLERIVVWEEQQRAYALEVGGVSFHARDTAVMLGHYHKACLLLMATAPSVESYYNSTIKKYAFIPAKGLPLAGSPLRIILNRARVGRQPLLLSPPFREKIESVLAAGRQVILLHHRKGYATYHRCTCCDWIVLCPHCNVPVSFYQGINRLRCPYCSYSAELYEKCPCCDSLALQQGGAGIEQLEELLMVYGEKYGLVCLDGVVESKAYRVGLAAFQEKKVGILVGTFSLLKVLPRLKHVFVAILDGNGWLRIPHYRAEEYVYHTLVRLAYATSVGAGNEVWIQHNSPTKGLLHRMVTYLLEEQDKQQYQHLLAERATYGYPPYKKQLKVIFSHPNSALLSRVIEQFDQWLIDRFPQISHWQEAAGFPYDNQLFVVAFWLTMAPEIVSEVKEELRKEVRVWSAKAPFSQKGRCWLVVDPVP